MTRRSVGEHLLPAAIHIRSAESDQLAPAHGRCDGFETHYFAALGDQVRSAGVKLLPTEGASHLGKLLPRAPRVNR